MLGKEEKQNWNMVMDIYALFKTNRPVRGRDWVECSAKKTDIFVETMNLEADAFDKQIDQEMGAEGRLLMDGQVSVFWIQLIIQTA